LLQFGHKNIPAMLFWQLLATGVTPPVAFFGAAVTKTSGPFFQNARGAPKFRFSSA
jgi:hypothetical protein